MKIWLISIHSALQHDFQGFVHIIYLSIGLGILWRITFLFEPCYAVNCHPKSENTTYWMKPTKTSFFPKELTTLTLGYGKHSSKSQLQSSVMVYTPESRDRVAGYPLTSYDRAIKINLVKIHLDPNHSKFDSNLVLPSCWDH